MVRFTFSEYTDMLIIYGEVCGSSAAAQRLYAERFPDRITPTSHIFVNLVQRLRETGQLKTQNIDTGAPRRRRTPWMEENVLSLITKNPDISIRRIAKIKNISHVTVRQILNDEGFPLRLHKVTSKKAPQAFCSNDCSPRVTFSTWFLQNCKDQPQFQRHILFTDEATFTEEGFQYCQDYPIQDEIDQHNTQCSTSQKKICINVWAAILNGNIIGPYILPRELTSENYLVFLEETLTDLLQDMPLDTRQNLWYQHDGAAPHFSDNVLTYLNVTFKNKWISRCGPVIWPSKSRDLTPMDFFIWDRIKTLIYETPVDSEEDLIARIKVAVEKIRGIPGIFDEIYRNLLRRCKMCIKTDSRQVE